MNAEGEESNPSNHSPHRTPRSVSCYLWNSFLERYSPSSIPPRCDTQRCQERSTAALYLLDVRCDVLLDVVLLQCLRSALHGVLLHLLRHVRVFDHCLSVTHGCLQRARNPELGVRSPAARSHARRRSPPSLAAPRPAPAVRPQPRPAAPHSPCPDPLTDAGAADRRRSEPPTARRASRTPPLRGPAPSPASSAPPARHWPRRRPPSPHWPAGGAPLGFYSGVFFPPGMPRVRVRSHRDGRGGVRAPAAKPANRAPSIFTLMCLFSARHCLSDRATSDKNLLPTCADIDRVCSKPGSFNERNPSGPALISGSFGTRCHLRTFLTEHST